MATTRNITREAVTASVALVWPFLALAKRDGWEDIGPRVCSTLGISEAQLADPATRVPIAQLLGLLDAALRRGGNRDLGLAAARRVDGVHLGLMEHVTRTRGTLRSALEAGIRYVPLVGEGVHYSFEVDDDVATSRIWFDSGIEMHEAAVEFVLAIGLLWARRTTGVEELAPLEIHFTHERPADISRHERLFRCKLFFGAKVTKVVMSAPALERRLAGTEPVLAGLLEQRAEDMLDALPRAADVTTEVRRMLAARRELQGVTAEALARRMGMSARTLARKLTAEATSYREVLDDVREQAARRALAESDRAIADIAESLGFASPQAFNRAFRRWTGTTAAAYRRSTR